MSITRSGGPPSGDEVQRVGGRAAFADRERAAVGERVFTPQILKLAAVVVLGSIMTILDMTIVNVGLATLGRDLQTSIATLQWVSTAYLLAFASVIPLTGWASERFGVRPLWLASLAGFMLGSLLAGLSWSIGALIAFRVVQGLGGGMIMPLGQTILAQAAGPQRMGRVMSIVGVPMLLAPIFGPVIGGAIVGAVSWRWMFFINLPVGGLALLLAVRLLPVVPRRPPERLDVRGLALLCGGIAIFIYGLAEIARQSTFTGALRPSMLLAGLTLVALFVWHALRIADPLIDVRLFAQRGFATAAATNFILGVALFGVALLLPLYFQIVRGTSPLQTGLLMIPQGLGAACAITLAGRLTDKLGARRVVPVGILIALAGTAAYTQIGPHTPYWYLAAALFMVGAGLGATITPSMAAAYRHLARDAVPRATSALNVVQRVAGSLGTALLAVVLQATINSQLPEQAAALAARQPAAATTRLADAFASTFWVAFALTATALLPALLLPDSTGNTSRHDTPTPLPTVAGGSRDRSTSAGQSQGKLMRGRRYLKPPWMQRYVGNRLAPLFRPSLVWRLSVPGRRTGRWHTLPIVVLDHSGERYLVSYRGESDWVLDLRASHSGRLAKRGQIEEITVVEVPVPDRPPLVEAYITRYGKMPTVAATLRALPGPADHPTFRIIAPAEPRAANHTPASDHPLP
jgi:EmrB/QacA subfamily drug resistance transporter